MKKLFKIIFSLFIILIGALIVAPFLIPMETYKKEAVTRLSEMTGRDIAIDGDMSFRILPDVAVVLNDVTIGNPKGFSSPHLAKMKQLNIGVALNPLFNKELVIQKFELDTPDIHLEQVGNKQNWQIEFNTPSLPTAELISSAHAAEDAEESGFTFKKLELSKLVIANGKLTYKSGNTTHIVEDASLISDAVRMDEPTTFEGGLAWNNERITFTARIDSLKDVQDGKLTPMVTAIDSKHLKLQFNGKASQSSIRGLIDAGSPSLVKAAQWLGAPMDWKQTPLLLAIKGDANCNTASCDIKEAELAIDDMRFAGNIGAAYSGKTSITGKLNTKTLDLTPYMQEKTAYAPGGLLISNAHAAANWSNDKIDLSGLTGTNVDMTLNADKIILPDLQIKKVKIQPQIRNGSASINIIQSEIFGGSMNGVITAIPRSNYINSSARISLGGIQMEQLLKATMQDAPMSGRATLSTNLSARGNSIASIIQTLSGSGKIKINDGALKGVNIGQMARNIGSAFTAKNSTEKTDFAEITATYSIAGGVISNSDLYMKAPLLRMKGEGKINLPAYLINYSLFPELVETSKGQGGKDKTGFVVPVLVTGALDNPKFAPDLKAMLANKEQLKENLKAAKEQFKERKGEVKQQFKDIKQDFKAIKEDPKELLKNPDKINEQLNNLLKGF